MILEITSLSALGLMIILSLSSRRGLFEDRRSKSGRVEDGTAAFAGRDGVDEGGKAATGFKVAKTPDEGK